MRSPLSLLFGVVLLGSSVAGAQAEPATPAAAEPNPPVTSPSVTPPPAVATVAPAVPASPPESKPGEPAAPAVAAPAPETPAVAATAEPPSGVTPPGAIVETVSKAPPPAPTPAPAVVERGEPRADLLAVRVNLMEQLLLAQHDREVNLYRDTVRLVTIFGGAFAAVCIIGLLLAAFLNYRALIAVQAAYGQIAHGAAVGPAGNFLAAPGVVPGIEKVQASGQRFQTRMSGLEQRLSELEHLAGRESSGAEGADHPADDVSVLAPDPLSEEAGLVSPPRRVVPRAMILVHKSQALMNLGKLNEALTTLDEAAALDGAKTEVHLARGQVLEKLGRLGDALRAYDTAVGADDQNTSALLMKAGVLNRQERFSEALACYERALEVHRATV